jgi:hypothetical protein
MIAMLFTLNAMTQTKMVINEACNYYNDNTSVDVFMFNADNDALSALKLITEASGLSPNFKLMAANVPNAAAVVQNGERYILYNQTFMYNISKKINYWASISILAHELGHHLNGHSLKSGGSRPSIEIEADKFSGFILAKLGSTLEDAQSAINLLVSEEGSLTHPGRSARLAAIANGWYSGGGKSNKVINNEIFYPTNSKPNIAQTNPAGRRISIKLKPLTNCKVYIGSYYGKSLVLVDSTMLDATGQGVFKGDTKLTSGVYFVVTPQITKQFEFLMDDVQHFNIEGDTTVKEKATITGSQDNDLFKAYISFSSEKGQQLQNIRNEFNAAKSKADSTRLADEYGRVDKLVEGYRNDIVKQYPSSLLAVLFSAMKRPVAPAVPIVNGKADSLAPYRFVKNHFWDDVLFNDDRLLRTPFFESKLDEYFKYYVSAEPDSIIEEVKYMLLMAKTGKEIYPYLLTKFTNKYMAPEFMGQDKVFVYLFENFYAKGDTVILNPASRKTVTERAYSLMANQLGLPAPPLDLVDSLGKAVSLYKIPSNFTMVVFYDPNCGHCKEELPRLDSFYRAKWKALGMTMLGVNIYDAEQAAWKKFITDKNLNDWIHAYQTKAAKDAEEKKKNPNYRQLYDIYKTPTVYLLDKDKRIIAKQLTIEQFDDIIQVKSKKPTTQ